jgi:hypothetical protein
MKIISVQNIKVDKFHIMRIFTSLFIGCAALFLVSCLSSPPGKGRKAEAGYKAAAPIIAALEKFHENRGHYPAHLVELVPTYLSETNDLLFGGKGFAYRLDADTYVLSFSYTGPGMNECWFDSKTRKWEAHGYY